MAGARDFVAKLVLKLQDNLSAGIERLRNHLGRLSAATRGIGLIGAAFAAISLAGPIREAAAFDAQLRDIAITAGLTGRAVEESIRRQRVSFEALALASGQSSTGIAGGAGLLAAAGMDPAQAEALLPIIARVATASGAAMNDIAQTAFSLSDALQVPAEQMPGALAALMVAGKEGRFELAAMAREFPGLTAAASALGLRGTTAVNSLAAALQIARKGAATESEAANNLTNFLAKIASPETVKNFEKMGVNLPRLLADAAAKGLNPIEVMIQKIRQLTNGDPFKLSQLFGDLQVTNFLRPMIANVAEYIAIRDKAAGAGASVIDADWAARMAGQQAALNRALELTTQITRRVGDAFAALVPKMLPALEGVRDWMAWLDGAAPGSIDLVLQIAGGLALLVTALAILGPVAGAVAGGFSVLVGGLSLVGAGIAALTAPVVAVIALVLAAAAVIGGAAYVIWRDWERYGPMFRRLWDGIKAVFAGVATWIRSVWARDWAGARAGAAAAWAGLGAAFRAIWDIVKGVFRTFATWVMSWAGNELTAAANVAREVWRLFSIWMGTLWGVIRQPFEAFAAWVVSWAAGPVAAGVEAIKTVWNALTGWFSSLVQQWRQPFSDFIDWVDRRLQPLRDLAGQVGRLMGRGAEPEPAAPGGPAAAPAGAGPGTTPAQRLANWRDRALLAGFPAPAAAGGSAPLAGEIIIRTQGDAEVVDARSNNPGVRLRPAAPNRGPTVGRP